VIYVFGVLALVGVVGLFFLLRFLHMLWKIERED